jgi:hypothetical protein
MAGQVWVKVEVPLELLKFCARVIFVLFRYFFLLLRVHLQTANYFDL